MAIKKQITDNKGVITRYHKIQSFSTDRQTITVRLRSFVNDALRQQELDIEATNAAAQSRQDEMELLQSQITSLMEQNVDGSKTGEIAEISEQVNAIALNPDQLFYQDVENLHASEIEIQVPHTEPITIAGLYQAIVDGDGLLAGGTEV